MNMIEDAVTQLKAGIDRTRAAQRRLYTTNQTVLVRSTSWSRGRELTTWSHATVVAAAWTGRQWFYRVRTTDHRGHHSYTIVGRGALKAV